MGSLHRTISAGLALAVGLCGSAALAQRSSGRATAEDVARFVASTERESAAFSIENNRAQWVNATYLTDDTDALAARLGAEGTEMAVRFALQAARYQDTPGLSSELSRKLGILRTGIVLPAPTAPGAAQELSGIITRLQSRYGKGKGTLKDRPIAGSDIEEEMGKTHSPDEYREMWVSWHDQVGRPMKADFERTVALGNAGARELGFADVGAMWRSGYDMAPDAFAALTEKIWQELKPLYQAVHCYTRSKLNEAYGDTVQPETGPIRADLLGNMWAQEWGNIYPVVAPRGLGDVGYDLTMLLKAKGYDAKRMVKAGENFYSSLGLATLPDSFWERSMFVKPLDREVVCHASAWDIDNKDDIRIKMCTKVNGDDFATIHHELGHNYYQRAYKNRDFLYLNGANDGFHEAIGDFVALSITPQYLVDIGLLDKAQIPGPDKDVGLLLRQAMDKVAFLPFGLLVDRWRWGVFDGSIKPTDYNTAWTAMRREYQGIAPPVDRPADAFDPGAKFHVPGYTPYMRYFLARVLQFQFYQAACRMAGWTGPLHRCSFYGNKTVGEKLNAMLSLGASKPWPDALQMFTGSRDMSGKALLAYFAPLKIWLDRQNRDRRCGW